MTAGCAGPVAEVSTIPSEEAAWQAMAPRLPGMPVAAVESVINTARSAPIARKNSFITEGSIGVLYPGEIEHRREQDRRQNGIEVEDSTWDKIKSLAQDYGLARQLAL